MTIAVAAGMCVTPHSCGGRTSWKYTNVYWMLTMCKALLGAVCVANTMFLQVETINPTKETDLTKCLYNTRPLIEWTKQAEPDEGAVQLAGGWNTCSLTNMLGMNRAAVGNIFLNHERKHYGLKVGTIFFKVIVNINFFITSQSNSLKMYNLHRVLYGNSVLTRMFNQLKYSVLQTTLEKHFLKLFYQMTSFHYIKIKLKVNYCLHSFRMCCMRF